MNLSKLILDSATGNGSKELDALNQARDEYRDFYVQTPAVMGASFSIPIDARAGITGSVDTTTASTGGPFKLTEGKGFLSLLRNRTASMRAGATVLTGLNGPTNIVKQLTDGSASWVAENPGSDLARTAGTYGSLSLAFKTVQAATALSRQTLFSAASGNLEADEIIQREIADMIAVAIDLGALNGVGSSNQPLGIMAHTGITTVAQGANGAAWSISNAATMEYNLAASNADVGNLAWVTTPNVRKAGRTTAAFTNGGTALWTDANSMIGYPAFATKQVPSNYTKGTSTTACSGLIFGAWQDLVIGFFGVGVDIIVDPYALKLQNMIDISVAAYVDVAVGRTESFNVTKDITT